MANKKQSSSISVANLVAIVGIVLLLVFTFLGTAYKNGGEFGWSFISTLGVIGFTVILLWFLIKAKGAENNLDKWKKVEIAALVIYVGFAITTSVFGGIMHFFVVNGNKDDLKNYAKTDLAKIDSLFTEYKSFESSAIASTCTGLNNSVKKGQRRDNKLNDFMKDNNISANKQGAQAFEIQKNKILLGSGFNAYYADIEKEKTDILQVVDSWSVMHIPFSAEKINTLAASAASKLSSLSRNANLPTISYSSSIGKYTIGELQYKNFSIQGTFLFKEALKGARGFSLGALLVVLLIHFMILFNYIVAYRTNTVGLSSKYMEEDGGKIL